MELLDWLVVTGSATELFTSLKCTEGDRVTVLEGDGVTVLEGDRVTVLEGDRVTILEVCTDLECIILFTVEVDSSLYGGCSGSLAMQ